MKFRKSTAAVLFIMLLGIGLLLYPSFSNWWNIRHQTEVIGGYNHEKTKVSESDYAKLILRAEEYNKGLANKSNERYILSEEDNKLYNEMLKIPGSDVMSMVEIPKINLKLPIYHGTDEAILQVAIGHIPGSSLPIGGKGTHSVVSGHTGLKSARLFTDITVLKKGDIFNIETLNESMTYEVDQIKVVLPNELDELMIDKSKDYVTLVTCTPYGVNTHRLLVRGVRINNDIEDIRIVSDLVEVNKYIVAIPFFVILLIIMLMVEFIKYLYKKGLQK